MNMVDVINKKKRGGKLSKEEINYFIQGYTNNLIPDYQAAALLMAIWFQGMDDTETVDLTQSIVESGDIIDLSNIRGVKVDKHSTGGVADTTTLIAAPLVAACGGKVVKMSGRGLGHTGGTLDKMESIPGLRVEHSLQRISEIVTTSGMAIIGQTGNLVPADKKLYALRDVTGTVDNISLIASSIMSKKVASGSDAIVLDVKAGSGAFINESAEAVKLAELMVRIGHMAGKNIRALVSDMSQPLGNAIGNALEVREAMEILSGKGDGALKVLSLKLAGQMLICSEIAENEEEAEDLLEKALYSGRAMEKFANMIEAQEGNPDVVTHPEVLPTAKKLISIHAEENGFIGKMDNAEIGESALLLGAGRLEKDDDIDPAVGIWMKKRIGENVAIGDEIAVFHVNDEKYLEDAIHRFKSAVTIVENTPGVPPLIYSLIK